MATYGDRAYRLAVGITGSAPDAEEVVQDALWSVIRKIDSFRGDSAFGSWLYRIVANAAYEKLRGRASRRAEVSLEDVLPAFHEDGRAAPIADWSSSLDDPSRSTALLLHDVEGLGNAEVAQALGLTLANVKSRVHRARLFVRQRLAATMAAPPAGEAVR